MPLLIKNGVVISPESRQVQDIRCRGGRIVQLGLDLEPAGEEIIDASGCFVFSGGVDPHVHMQLPVAGTVSSDSFETGSGAALAGGTTTLIDFVHPERGENFLDALAARKHEGQNSVCDWGLHMAITWWGDSTAEWMAHCVQQGIPSFKTYMAYKESVGLDDIDLVRAMQTIADLGGTLLMHAEHGEAIEHLRSRFAAENKTAPRFHALSRPSALEGEATNRAVVLAGLIGTSLYVVHVTCREAAEAIARGQRHGWPVTGETCPQYLLLEDSVYDRPDFESAAFVIAPPIRPASHQEDLWSALSNQTLSAVGTDHCPFNMAQKRIGENDFRMIPGGAAGIEHRLALLWTYGVGEGRIDPGQFVDLVSTQPARIFGLYPRKGSIAVGSDADVVLWDASATATISAATHHHNCDRSIFEGFEVTGLPMVVVSAGNVVYQEGSLRVEKCAGRFLERLAKNHPGSPVRIGP
jgi:dihydropyrimidinase